MTTGVRVDAKELGRVLAADPQVQAVLKGVAGRIEDRVEETGPVGTGYFAHRSLGSRRVGPLRWTVFTRDVAGHLIEFGSVNNRPYAPFRRAVRGLGLSFKERPKP